MQVFVVSLTSAVKRRQQISELLYKTALNWEFVDAVNGSSGERDDGLDDHNEDRRCLVYDQTKAIRILGRPLVPGEIGCTLSHLKIYAMMLMKGISAACILEDDALFDPATLERICAAYATRPSEPEIVMLGHLSAPALCQHVGAEGMLKAKGTLAGHGLYQPVEFPFLSHAYLVNHEAASTLLRYGTPASFPLDWLTGAAELLGINLFLIRPPIAIQRSEPTLIAGRTYPRHEFQRPSNELTRLFGTFFIRAKRFARKILIALRRRNLFRTSYIAIFNHSLWIELVIRKIFR